MNMNAKQLIAAVFALTAVSTAFADQNATRPFTGKTRADAVVAQQQVQKTTHAGHYKPATTPNTAFTHN
jgi:hypothetical protein